MLLSLTEYLIPCPIKNLIGIDCLGCGFQRSIALLIQGDIKGSIAMYPATIPIILLLLSTVMHIIFKFKNGARIIQYLFILCVIIIGFNYGYKIATGDIF